MRGISKKMFISILTSVIVMVTMVATTFAWVGIFTYANTDNFQFNLKVSELDANYYLTISSTGKKGSFSDEADPLEIKKQIIMNLNNWKREDINKIDDKLIDNYYQRYCITTPSSCTLDDNQLSNFYSINNKNSERYETYSSSSSCIKFDLYLSVDTKEGIKTNENGLISEDVNINSNVFITELEDTLSGTISDQMLTNLNPYKNNSIPVEYSILKTLPDKDFFKINSANASRFALSLYEPININDSYNGNEKPTKTLIYHGGNQLPELKGDVYDLGGNLPEDYNVALQELLIIRPNYKNSVYSIYNQKYESDLLKAIDRGKNDLDLIEENSSLWEKPLNVDNSPFLGVYNGIQTKMKITVYFWFEGWDADCIKGIDNMPVTLNLTFTAGTEE